MERFIEEQDHLPTSTSSTSSTSLQSTPRVTSSHVQHSMFPSSYTSCGSTYTSTSTTSVSKMSAELRLPHNPVSSCDTGSGSVSNGVSKPITIDNGRVVSEPIVPKSQAEIVAGTCGDRRYHYQPTRN